jgi:hypothetical protein
LSTQSRDDAVTPPLPITPRPDTQRRRREVALTARWLRELRGGGTGDARPAAQFTRPVKQ